MVHVSEHTDIVCSLFTKLRTAYTLDKMFVDQNPGQQSEHYADARAYLLSEYYTGDHWAMLENLVLVGNRLGIRINFPQTKVKYLDHRYYPIAWPRWVIVRELGDRKVYEVKTKSLSKLTHHDHYALREALKVTKVPALLSQAGDYCVLTYFDEVDAIIAQTTLEQNEPDL